MMRLVIHHDILLGNAHGPVGGEGFVNRTFIGLFLTEVHAALKYLVTCFTFNILQAQVVVLQECLVGTDDF